MKELLNREEIGKRKFMKLVSILEKLE